MTLRHKQPLTQGEFSVFFKKIEKPDLPVRFFVALELIYAPLSGAAKKIRSTSSSSTVYRFRPNTVSSVC